ncbi:MAG TPA: FtsX-like permease family protein [Lachnospiraceae bacterium]|nr:FtsX-like permease family protein [Lachnospiraceae bacterium]
MWRKKLKHRKHQFLLIGLVLAFATAIFAGCISFTLETNVYGKQFFNDDDQCPNIISLTKGSCMQDYFLENDEVMTNIKDISYQSAKYIEATMNFGKKTIPNSYTAVIAVKNYHELPYFMKLTDEDIKVNAPGNDEIWVSNALADEYGINVGDKISFNGTYQKELTVSALYNSAVIPSGMMGIFPFYTNEATLQQFDESDATYITVLLKDGVDADTALSSLSSDYSSNVYYSFDRQAMNLTYSTTSTLFGSIGTLAALIIFIVTVILIRFLLRTTLIKEYRSIGIYKSLGYTSKQIIGFYRNCYLFVGAIAIPIGILLGIGIANILGGITNQYLDGYHTTVITLYTGIFSFFLLILILIGNVILTLRSIPKITPVKALTIGLTSSKVKMKRSLIRNAHSSLSMAINQIFKRKAMSIMVLFILTVSF